jgi:hypothetical protein
LTFETDPVDLAVSFLKHESVVLAVWAIPERIFLPFLIAIRSGDADTTSDVQVSRGRGLRNVRRHGEFCWAGMFLDFWWQQARVFF